MSTTRQCIVFALDNVFCLRKSIVIARMVHVEMGTDEEIDIGMSQAKIGELLKHIFSLPGWRRPRWWRVVRRESAINQDMLSIAGLDEIATQDHFQRAAACYGYGRGPQLQKIESLWSCTDHCHSPILS